MTEDPVAILPEIALLAGAVTVLLLGSYLPRERLGVTRAVTVATLLVSGAAAVPALDTTVEVFGSFSVDRTTGVVRLVVVAATLMVVLLGADELAGSPRQSETYSLLLLASLGSVVMAATSDLSVLAVTFLLASIPVYALIGLSRTPAAAEATLKAYLLGALFNIILLLGATLLFAMAGGTGYGVLRAGLAQAPSVPVAVGLLAVLAGLMFKAGGVPAHFWVPDATQASGTAVAGFLTTVPKIGALVAMSRLLSAAPVTVQWPLVVAVLAAATMTLGNLAALVQTDVRRLLGWSTVSQVGYLLLPVAVADRSGVSLPSLLVYLVGYAVTNLTAFAVVAAAPERRTLVDYRGLARTQPWLVAALTIALLSLVGTPPSAVFLGKLLVFTSAWDGGFAWLVVVAAVNTVVSLAYYLRWIGFAVSQDRAATVSAEPARRWAHSVALVGGAGTLIVGLAAGGLTVLAGGGR